MLFVVTATDMIGALALRMKTREAHLAYLREGNAVKLAGPFVNEQGEPVGSMLIIEAADLDAAKAWAAADPYAKAGLFLSSDVRRWNATINLCEAKL